jgi:pyroglutamyl-peptidase
MMRVLMTSFEPFGGHALNSSLEVGRALASQALAGIHLEWLTLPVVARACVEKAWQGIERARPALVLALGQSSQASVVRLEDVALNIDDFPIPDNAGNQPKNQWIIPGAATAYRSTARLTHLLSALAQRSIPHEHSFHAGTYVCNHLYYGLLHRSVEVGSTHQTLFVHLPLLPNQVPDATHQVPRAPSQPLEHLVEAVRQVIRVCLE